MTNNNEKFEDLCDEDGKPCDWCTEDYEDCTNECGEYCGTGDTYCVKCYRYRDWSLNALDGSGIIIPCEIGESLQFNAYGNFDIDSDIECD